MKIPVDQQFVKYSDRPVWLQQPFHVQSHLIPFLPHSDARFELQQVLFTTSRWLNALLPNKVAGECICIYNSMYIYYSWFFSIVILFLHSILIQFFILFTFTHAINIKLILNALYFLIYLYLKLLKLVAKQLNLAKSHMCWLWNTVDFNYIHLFTIYIQILVILHTFIQSDLQMRTIEAIKTNKRAIPCKCYYKSR